MSCWMMNYGSAEETEVQILYTLGRVCVWVCVQAVGGQLSTKDEKHETWKLNSEQRLSSVKLPTQHWFEMLIWYEDSKTVLSLWFLIYFHSFCCVPKSKRIGRTPEVFCDLLMSWRREKEKKNRKEKLKEEDKTSCRQRTSAAKQHNFSQTSGTCTKRKWRVSIISTLSMHTQGFLQLLHSDNPAETKHLICSFSKSVGIRWNNKLI